MKIQQFEVSGLHDNEESITLNFHDDLNILSGRNGAGKTTILKLMWYLISGNFDKAVAEIKFNSAILTTDKYQLNVEVNYDEKENPLKSSLILKNKNILKNFEEDEVLTQLITSKKNKEIAWFLTQYIDSSFFMPTFRMIEGGFTTEKYDIQHDVLKEFYLDINKDNDYNDIAIALYKLSKNLSKQNHLFITSISAKDIDIFLVKKYAEIMKKVNVTQGESVSLLSNKIKLMFRNGNHLDTLKSIDKKLEVLRNEINVLNEPLDKLKSSINHFMPQFKVGFDEKVYFNRIDDTNVDEELEESEVEIGYTYEYDNSYEYEETSEVIEPTNQLTINNLSAGEKQLLTFVSYNIFHNDTIFFIDEPELSLHVDWQNKLFSLLKEQNPSNQFIISTHSPFIYSLFPDKELIIDADKGCSEF
ncbi:AAA family ATPase [Acinetobacter baumannii]|uniref:AAA family ATPase n=1 Tax=Acinetobacter baumannii TaxID=470 RepID=UPI000DE6ABA5|nr:AAA family ATPase [Acinetobacter baumannii]SSU02608.1 putative ATP-binding protein involved in virulence [Acinetobacter baumannii]SSU57731.1 putative ATP-binding protein involved in virulence [Acinetobacter baumannii]SSU82510.1 putative ATP-binding protein involved in virulence [Acinetobacter baumannii]SSV78888.1 putative ATP-binding protein involved in virulence [Acinetobacter baumannii]